MIPPATIPEYGLKAYPEDAGIPAPKYQFWLHAAKVLEPPDKFRCSRAFEILFKVCYAWKNTQLSLHMTYGES